MKDLANYTLLNYRKWVLGDEARKGANIKRLGILWPIEVRLFDASIPYLDQRDDPGHTETSLCFGITLLNHLSGLREVVVPAITEHDSGWHGYDPQAWKRLVEVNKGNLKALNSEASRRAHQNRGIMIAGKIFQKVSYPDEKFHPEIADIIGDHDTKLLPTTDNGRIVRISDLLWRVTYPHAQIHMADQSPREIAKRIEETCLEGEKIHLGEIGTAIGRLEFANTMHWKFGDEAKEVLLPKYAPELERVIDFYN